MPGQDARRTSREWTAIACGSDLRLVAGGPDTPPFAGIPVSNIFVARQRSLSACDKPIESILVDGPKPPGC